MMPRSFLLQSAQSNIKLATVYESLLYCASLHLPLYDSPERALFTGVCNSGCILCPTLISGASSMNLGNRGCTLEAESFGFPNLLGGRTISQQRLCKEFSSRCAFVLYRCGELHFCSTCAASSSLPISFLNI